MTPDQYDKLKRRSEQLTEIAIAELDASSWPGDGKRPADLTKDERGDRYWSKRNAAATLTLVAKIAAIVDFAQRGAAPPPTPDDDRDFDDITEEIVRAESEAAAVIQRFSQHRGEKP